MKKIFLFSLLIAFFGLSFAAWQPLYLRDSFVYFKLIWANSVKYKIKNNISYLEKNNCTKTEICTCVFFVHGLGDRSSTWQNFFYSQKKLKSPTQLIAIDLPGAGRSPFLENPEAYEIKNLAIKYNNLIKSTCQSKENIILVGNSFGGWITQWMNQLNFNSKDAYKANFLLNSAGLNLDYSGLVESFTQPDPKNVDKLYKLSNGYSTEKQILPWFIARHASARFNYYPTKDMIYAQAHKNMYIDKFLEKTKSNTYLYWGEKDFLLGKQHLDAYSKLLDKKHIETNKKCSHIPHVQCFDDTLEFINSRIM